MHVRRVLRVLLTVVLAGLGARAAGAQANNLAQVYVVRPTAGAATGFEAALAQHAQWRRDNNDPWSWTVYQVVTGQNLGDYVIRSAGHTWADFDAYDAEFGPQGLVHWNATVAPLVETASGVITAGDTANVRWPDDPSSISLVALTTYYLKPGQNPAFFEHVAKFHQAIVDNDYPVYYGFATLVSGGPGPQVTIALLYENWAAFQGPAKTFAQLMIEVYGEEEMQRLFDGFAETFLSTESSVLRARPDLSVNPGM